MSRYAWPNKHPEAVECYTLTFQDLAEGETVTEVAWTIPTGLTKVAQDLDGNVGLIWLAGGVEGTTYTIIAVPTTSTAVPGGTGATAHRKPAVTVSLFVNA